MRITPLAASLSIIGAIASWATGWERHVQPDLHAGRGRWAERVSDRYDLRNGVYVSG